MEHRPRFDKFFELLLLVSGIIFMQLLVVLCIDGAGYLSPRIYAITAYFSLSGAIIAVYGRMISDLVRDIVVRWRSRVN
jgi:hypothetical protein